MSTSSTQAYKRTSTVPSVPSAPAPNHHINPAATVHEKAQLTGSYDITIAADAIIHPYAKIVASHGRVDIREGCVVWEQASVGLLEAYEHPDGQDAGGKGQDEMGVVVERHVVIEANAVVEAKRVGESCVVEVGARIGHGAVLGQHSKLAPLTEVAPYDVLPDFTVVFGEGSRRINQTLLENDQVRVLQENGHERHLQLMKKLISVGAKRI